MKRGRKLIVCGLFWIISILGPVLSAKAGTIYESPYVSFSPDGQAWTTDAGNRAVEWYAEDGSDDIVTGVASTLRPLDIGEHYYKVQRRGSVPIAVWKVYQSRVNCCHHGYPSGNFYHGVSFTREACLQPHFSAWRPICADCGNPIVYNHFYMSKQAAGSIDHLQLGEQVFYYYLCPFNRNLEQGVQTGWHNCKAVSANRYRVEYLPNTEDEVYSGNMAPSFHFWNNATEYEGRGVTPQTHLNRNTYRRIGWVFLGWNTKEDGSGTFFEDEGEILNLCEGDYDRDAASGNVRLYAMWKPSKSKLSILLNGCWYENITGMYTVERGYGDSYELDTEKLDPLGGFSVSFETNGGNAIAPMQGKRHFVEWQQLENFQGSLIGSKYYFYAQDGHRDKIRPVFAGEGIVLPKPVKTNFTFAGWFYDPEFTRPAGKAGDLFLADENLTLYAQWARLVLESEDNYRINGGIGAVDLSWSQNDGQEKVYKIFQSTDGASWKQVLSADDIKQGAYFAKSVEYDQSTHFLTVPYSGFYRLCAYGAQGGNYGSFLGGKGGMAEGSFWLDKGESVFYCAGGQQGFNGGGKATRYANGGGYSIIYTDRGEVLVIAGGGGGAGATLNGYPGGSAQSLISSGRTGETGECGGGGGYRGGHAGELVVHHHQPGVCNHLHTGNPSQGGGCYQTPIKCGEKLGHKIDHVTHWYWAGEDTTYCPACGADATKGETCSGHDTVFYKHLCSVHGQAAINTSSKSPAVCSVVMGYGLSCGQSEEYTCGYEEGQILRELPAYGGSNYVNTGMTRFYATYAGQKSGNGSVQILSENIGFQNDTCLEAVKAADREAPEIIGRARVSITPVGENRVCLSWRAPKDRGSIYYHQAKSYSAASGTQLTVSNITENTLISGIAGYFYVVDESAETPYNSAEYDYTEERQVSVDLSDREQYFHVAAVDKAGNVGAVCHIPIGSKKKSADDIAWPVYTEMLRAETSDAVCQDKAGHYFVRADGKTPFTVDYSAYMTGPAADHYQLIYCCLESIAEYEEPLKSRVYIPRKAVQEGRQEIRAEELHFEEESSPDLRAGDYISVERLNSGRKVSMRREYLLDAAMDGRQLTLIPGAGAGEDEPITYSDSQLDKENQIILVGDGTAPVIHGLDALENLPVLDRREMQIILQVTAEDELSGLAELYLEIYNFDNGAGERIYADDQGSIVLNITADEPEFSGDFSVTAHACDRVGNESELTYATTEFDLRVEVERVLEPHEPIFRRGESGRLKLTTWGYADRVEVEFPVELTRENPDLDRVYRYELKASYRQEEIQDFVIPLYAPEKSRYEVIVRAYKGDKMLEERPAFGVLGISGSVLDELRTILR